MAPDTDWKRNARRWLSAFPKVEFSALVRTATFRLAVAQAIVFTAFTLLLLAAVYAFTVGQFTREADLSVDTEYAALSDVHAKGGVGALNNEVIQRMASQVGALYVLADKDAQLLSGSFDRMPIDANDEQGRVDFRFSQSLDSHTSVSKRARGRIGRLPDGAILLVARDLGDANAIVARIWTAIWIGAIVGLALSLVAGFIASRQAARRAHALSQTARDVMAGDLSRRAPLLGGRDEFQQLAIDINAMLERLEKFVAASKTVGDSIAHDLRTPLTRLRQNLDAALDHDPDPVRDRDALSAAREECDNLLATFAAILKITRMQSPAGWPLYPVDLTKELNDVIELYEVVAEEEGLGFSADIAPGLTLMGDRALLVQAVANLLDNAIKFTPKGESAKIAIAARRERGGAIAISVSDTGPGIPPEEREHAKERFVQLEKSRTKAGVGLGLSLVQAVAEVHKGRFDLYDGLGGPHGPGLRAELTLPGALAGKK